MTDFDAPAVTVLIPARNEEGAIERCLDGIGAQDYPLNRVEVIVVDGDSSDATARICHDVLWRYGFKQTSVLHNPAATTPTSLNLGLAEATGDYVCRVDARSLIPPDYITRCVGFLEQNSEATVVGGSQVAVAPPDADAAQIGIARALNNRFAMGGSRYRSFGATGECDTAYMGFFRTSHLRLVEGWDEQLSTNQDFDICQRLAAHGSIWFLEGLPVAYEPRDSLQALARQYSRFGRWKAHYWKTRSRPNRRQLILLALPFVGALIGLPLLIRRPLLTLIAGAGAAAAVEELGTTGPATGLQGRAHAVAAMAAITGSWSGGIWSELVGGSAALPSNDRLSS